MAVVRMVQRADQPLGIAQRPKRLDPLRRDYLEGHPDRVRGAAILVILVHTLAVGRETQISGHVETDRLPDLFLQAFVEIDAVFMQLADGVAHIEQRQQPGRVPRRAGGQFRALQQRDIRPAFLGQMIKHADADDSAADHNHPGM